MSASHTRVVPSKLAVASQAPSGLKAAPGAMLVWAVNVYNGVAIVWAVSASQTDTLPSRSVIASRVPSGLKAAPPGSPFLSRQAEG